MNEEGTILENLGKGEEVKLRRKYNEARENEEDKGQMEDGMKIVKRENLGESSEGGINYVKRTEDKDIE